MAPVAFSLSKGHFGARCRHGATTNRCIAATESRFDNANQQRLTPADDSATFLTEVTPTPPTFLLAEYEREGTTIEHPNGRRRGAVKTPWETTPGRVS